MFSTTTQGDRINSGQDFDVKVGTADNVLGKKRLSQRARTVRNIPDLGIPEIEDGSLGPEIGWHLYEPSAIGNNPPVWSEAFPVVSRVKKGGGGLEYRLVGPEKWEDADDRWSVPDAATPDENLYPGGWVFASLRTTDENAQRVALLPGFVGLVAPHSAGNEDYGTPVYDLTADNALDRDRKAPLQSLCRVYSYPQSQCVSFGAADDFGIALQLGDARKDRAGFGIVADAPTAGAAASPVGAGPVVSRGTINQVLAALSVNSGGFIDVGNGVDIHRLGINADGEVCNGAHIAESANYRGPTGDAPKEYDPTPYIPPATPPYLVPTFHRLDRNATHNWKCGERPGLRKWESLSYFRIKDGDEPPPLEDPLPPPPDGSKSERVFVTGRTRRELDLALTDLEMGMVGIVGVPQHHGAGKQDLRNATSPRGGREAFRLARDRGELRRPAVGRMEWGGKQRGSGWDLTNPPGASVYRDGDAQGFLAFMPSNYSLGYAAPPVSPGMQVLLWDSDLFFGSPDLSLGKGVSGWRLYRAAGGDLRMASVDASGTESLHWSLNTSGNLTQLNAVTAGDLVGDRVSVNTGGYLRLLGNAELQFRGGAQLLSVINATSDGSNRTLTLPWVDATLATLEDAETFSGAKTFSNTLYHSGAEFGVFGSVSTQPGAISNPSGGGTVDSESRTAIGSILTALRDLGLIAT